ncbi:MAG: DUF167 domain-containing protein [Candidatus Paceibacterota bacterium]
MHIKVKVYPNSKYELVREGGKDAFTMYIREPPIEGQANKRVLDILKEHYPHTRLRLVGGHLKHNKVFEIIP